MYQEWMHEKWRGFQSKDDTIRLIELSYNWGEFLDDLQYTLEALDNE